jgi:hypothetical protein
MILRRCCGIGTLGTLRTVLNVLAKGLTRGLHLLLSETAYIQRVSCQSVADGDA